MKAFSEWVQDTTSFNERANVRIDEYKCSDGEVEALTLGVWLLSQLATGEIDALEGVLRELLDDPLGSQPDRLAGLLKGVERLNEAFHKNPFPSWTIYSPLISLSGLTAFLAHARLTRREPEAKLASKALEKIDNWRTRP